MSYYTILQLILVFLFLLFIYKFIIVALLRLNFYKKQGLKTEFFPVLGSLLIRFQKSQKKQKDAIYHLKSLAAQEPNLKVIVQNFGATPVVLLLDPALKKEFAFNHDNYEISDVVPDFAKIFIQGLSGVKGEEWKKQRKIIAQAFHFDFLKENVPVMVNTTRSILDEISRKDLSKILIREEMERITGEIIGRIFFSENFQNYRIEGKPVTEHLLDTIEGFAQSLMSVGFLLFGSRYVKQGFWKSHRDLLKNLKLLEKTCNEILEDRRSSTFQTKDLAWYLLESQKNAKEEDRLTNEVIVSNYVIFITAGMSTTSLLISTTLFALAQNPAMLERLKEEIKEIYDKELPPSLDTLNKMNWLSALLKETLRVYNPVGLGTGLKQASRDHKIGDIDIKKGSMVVGTFVHKSFALEFFEDAFIYNPQRWLDKPNVSDPYAYTLFWAGPRNCIGQHLALMESKIILCEFIKKFDFELPKDYKPELGLKKGYGPTDNLPMKLTIRKE